MPDPLIEAQINTVFNYPIQSMCFIVGGLLVFVGLGMATIIPGGKWNSRGIALLSAGALIAFPAVIPVMLKLVGGSPDAATLLPGWILPSIYVVIPIAGVVTGIYGWVSSCKSPSKI